MQVGEKNQRAARQPLARVPRLGVGTEQHRRRQVPRPQAQLAALGVDARRRCLQRLLAHQRREHVQRQGGNRVDFGLAVHRLSHGVLGGLFLEPVLAHLPDHREFLARALERVIRALREPQRAAALAHHAALRARGGVADRLPYGEGRKALAKACGVRVDEHEVVGETREAEDERAVQPGSVEGVGGLGREGRGGEDAGAGEPLLVGHLGEEEDVRVEGDAVEGPHSQLQARESVVQRHGVSSPGGRAEVLEIAVADATTLEKGVEAVLR